MTNINIQNSPTKSPIPMTAFEQNPPIIEKCLSVLPQILSQVGTTDVGSVCTTFHKALPYARHIQAMNVIKIEEASHLLSAFEIYCPEKTTIETASQFLQFLSERVDQIRNLVPTLSPSISRGAVLVLDPPALQSSLEQILQNRLTNILSSQWIQRFLSQFGIVCPDTISSQKAKIFFPLLHRIIDHIQLSLPQEMQLSETELPSVLYDGKKLETFLSNAYLYNFALFFAKTIPFPQTASLSQKLLLIRQWIESGNAAACESLNCSSLGLFCIPVEIGLFQHLRVLNAADNNLFSLPSILSPNGELQEIYLDDNNFDSIPESLYTISSLRTLSLSQNQLSRFSEDPRSLSSLTSLNIANNDLPSIPNIVLKLTNLKNLDISENIISEIPSHISDLQKLETLNASSNTISALPQAIRQLTRLSSLDLSANGLEKIPNELGTLTALSNLDLSDNEIEVLPPSLFNLTNLKSLCLDTNLISELPKEIRKLQKLQELRMFHNLLTDLPDDICFLPRIQTLYLIDNQIEELPPHFSQLPSSVIVNLDENMLI